MNDTIFLIGGRATGKTTIGSLLAKRLPVHFVDMDKMIEERAGQTIKEIVEKGGWKAFRQQEHKLLLELCDQKNLIVATGGGAILHQDLWPQLKEQNLVVWLKADSKTTKKRMKQDDKSQSQRPSLTGESIAAEAEKVLAEREPLYRASSHIEINTEETLEAIVAAVEKEYLKKNSTLSF